MTEGSLPLVFTCGERAVCHLVDPAAPARDLEARVALYFAPAVVPAGGLVWRSSDGARPLDPARPIGDQVPAEAEIELQAP